MGIEDILRARLDRACNYNRVLGGNLMGLFRNYERAGQSALNEADIMPLDQLLDCSLDYYELKARITAHLQEAGYQNPTEARLDNSRKMLAEAKEDVAAAQHSAEQEAAAALERDTRAKYEAAAQKIASEGSLSDINIPSFTSLEGFLELIVSPSANYTQGAIITGSAGIGKTRRVISKLTRAGVVFKLFNSYSTPLATYESLYRNNGQTIIFDDTTGILQDKKTVAILKAALFSTTGERLITYSSTAKVLEERGIPESFIFTGRIIIILNEIPQTLRESFQALLSRVYHHNVALTLDEKKLLVRHVFLSDSAELIGLNADQRTELLGIMESVLDFSNAHKYNVRTALRAAEIYSALGKERAQDLIYDLLEVDTRLRHFLFIEKYGGSQPVEKRVEAFVSSTGYSRRVYFDLKARYYGTKYGKAAGNAMQDAEIKGLFAYMGGN